MRRYLTAALCLAMMGTRYRAQASASLWRMGFLGLEER